jgi:hypothetical protein
MIARPRKGKHRAPLPFRDLRQDMGRSTKTIESQLFAVSDDHQRPPADQAGTEQGGKRDVAAGLAEREREACIGNRRGG